MNLRFGCDTPIANRCVPSTNMGCTSSRADREAFAKSKAIDRMLRLDFIRSEQEIRLLLLGMFGIL